MPSQDRLEEVVTAQIGGTVASVAADAEHRFSKPVRTEIRLLAGLGVEGDAHLGVTVQHRSRVAVDPTRPNLRQVHLIHAELLDELAQQGFRVGAGELGENILTRGIDLLALPRGSLLHIGAAAVVEVTGLRNPCHQIEEFQPGLMAAVLGRDAGGAVRPRSGIMAVVRSSGTVRPGDAIRVSMPAASHERLERV
jgi:hypothetical protein